MTVPLPHGIHFEQKDGDLIAKRADRRTARAARPGSRAGGQRRHRRHQGFKKDLDIVGVGYRAEVKGKNVVLALGYSHPIEFPIPEGIQIAVEKQTHMSVSGANKNQVGQVAANLRALRPPDPYKQKGIRITGERLKKKAGKAGAKTVGANGARKEKTRGSTSSKTIARGAPPADSRAHAQDAGRHAGASAALRAPLEQAHSRAGGGRPDRAHASFPPARSTPK